jgi:AbrB family looped-hinge helix DNA binding protein
MHAIIYGRGQMVIPAKARKQAGVQQGDVVSVEPQGDGQILLVRLQRPAPRPSRTKIRYRKGTHAVGTAGRKISSDDVRALLADFP